MKEEVTGEVVQYMNWQCPNEECGSYHTSDEVTPEGVLLDAQCVDCDKEVLIRPEY
jgi:hypothetical protein